MLGAPARTSLKENYAPERVPPKLKVRIEYEPEKGSSKSWAEKGPRLKERHATTLTKLVPQKGTCLMQQLRIPKS